MPSTRASGSSSWSRAPRSPAAAGCRPVAIPNHPPAGGDMFSRIGALRVAFCAALLALLLASPAGAATKHRSHVRHGGGGLSVTSEPFGTLPATIDGGKAVTRYTLTNGNGM